MTDKLLLQEHAHRLAFFVDPRHPQEVRETLERWLRPLRAAGAHVGTLDLEGVREAWEVLLPAASGKFRQKGHLRLYVRPVHRDFFGESEQRELEGNVDAVLEAQDEHTFYRLVASSFKLELAREGAYAKKYALKHQHGYERAMRQAMREVALSEVALTEFQATMGKFLVLQEQLVGSVGFDTLSENLELLSRRLDKKKNWRLLRGGLRQEPDGELFYLGQLRGEPIFLLQEGHDGGPLTYLRSALIVGSLMKLVRKWEMSEAELKPGHVLQEAFQVLPVPLLFVEENGSVLQHNSAFGRLNLTPSKAQRLTEYEQVKGKDISWTVHLTSVASSAGQRTLYSFLPQRGDVRGQANSGAGQELGIITSSIAHELNNPIAGLLAALELLRLDEGWEEEELSQLEEMRNGALRCKQLIGTFLGFSRIKTEHTSTISKELVRSCFEQALNLHRFRMVESEFRMILSHNQAHPFAFSLHSPTVTMLAYLVIGEVMTAFQHLKLLERRSAKGMVMNLMIDENADRFSLMFSPAVSPKQGFNSKLLNYLLQQEKLQLEILESGELLFTHQNVLI